MSHNLRLLRLGTLVLLALSITLAPARPPTAPQAKLAASTGAWTVYHHDDGHTGYDATLPAISSATTGWTSAALDQEIFASPLIFNGIVYAATLNNTVYALNQATGVEIWHLNLGVPVSGGWICGDVSPQGILGTPVIDVAGGRIYVATLFNSDHLYHVFGLSLATGAIQLQTTIPASIGTGFDWSIQQQRGALAVRNGYVYVPFGGRAGDCANPNTGLDYHGWVVGVPTSGSTTLAVYQTANGIGIWTSGGVIVDDATGNVFAATGNGIGDGCSSVNQNDAVIRLSPTLALQDYFMPNDWQANWCNNDQDLGSAGPLLISPNLLFQAGKWGGGFLLDPNVLGHVDGQRFPTPSPATYSQAEVCLGNHSAATFGSFAYAAPFIYVECDGGRGLVALFTNTSTPSFSPCNATCAMPSWRAGVGITFDPPIVAGGAVWAASDGGGLYAYNATTGTQIFHSAGFSINRFVTPAEAGGQVFVPSRTVIRSFNMNFISGTSLGGVLTSSPDASSWGATRTDVFARGSDNGLWHRSWNGTTWAAWESLGGVLTSSPAAVSWGPNRIDIFVRGTDNGLWHRSSDGTTWSAWESLGGGLTSAPEVSSWGVNHLDVFVGGTNNHGLWQDTWNGTSWTWTSLGGVITSDPGAVSSTANRIDVFVVGTDNHGLWQDSWNGTTWTWTSLGGYANSGPGASSCTAGHLDMFVIGSDGGLWQRGFNGTAWQGWQSLGGQWTSDPGAVCPTGTTSVDVFERGPDEGLWLNTYPGS